MIKETTSVSDDEIIEILKLALIAHDQSQKIRYFYARVLIRKREFNRAIQECNILIRQNFKLFTIHGMRGKAFSGMQRYSEALHDYQEQLRHGQNRPEPYSAIADIHLAMGNLNDALYWSSRVDEIGEASHDKSF